MALSSDDQYVDTTASALPAPVDRRVRRSRRALQAALVALSAQNGYETLTVDDLTTHADMARRTFYAHFVDKEDLLRCVVTELVDELIHSLPGDPASDLNLINHDVVQQMFAHGQANLASYRMILAGAGNGIGLRMLANSLSAAIERAYRTQCSVAGVEPRLPIDFIARCFVGEHLTLLRWWLDNQNDYTLAQMSAMRLEVFLNGELWALGLTADPAGPSTSD